MAQITSTGRPAKIKEDGEVTEVNLDAGGVNNYGLWTQDNCGEGNPMGSEGTMGAPNSRRKDGRKDWAK